MRRRGKFRFQFELYRELYPPRGLGVWMRRGHMGSTYGEDGDNMFAEATLLFFYWQFCARLYWKDYGP